MMTDRLFNNLQRYSEITNIFACATAEDLFIQPPTKKLCEMASSPFATTSSRQPTLRPRLPVEILDTILSFLPITALKPLLVTNSFISTLSTRRFYHTVLLIRPIATIEFFCTLLSNPELPKLVRSLNINMNHTTPISNFYTLLQRVLHQTTGLLSLYLELPKTHSPLWIFDGCTFKLKQFSTTMYCRRPLAEFLETQDQITDLTLRGYQTDSMFFLPFIDPLPPSMLLPPSDMFSLAAEALPRLKAFNAVHSDACVVQAVVQGRPVEVVSIPLFPEMSIAALDALRMSTAPLKRLSVISFDPAAPAFLFEALAKRFDQLEALHLVMLMAEYSNELLEQSGALLSNFKCLKYITFMAATGPATPVPPPVTGVINATDNDSGTVNEEDEAHIAKVWHRACPSLRTIILPKGKVWFQNAPDAAPVAGQTAGSGTATVAQASSTATVENDTDEAQGESEVQEEEESWSHL